MKRPKLYRAVYAVDDLLSIVELAQHLEAHAAEFAPVDDDGNLLPLRVSVGDGIKEQWAVNVTLDPGQDVLIDFNGERRPG